MEPNRPNPRLCSGAGWASCTPDDSCRQGQVEVELRRCGQADNQRWSYNSAGVLVAYMNIYIYIYIYAYAYLHLCELAFLSMHTVFPGKQKGFTWFQYSNYGWQVQIDPKIVNLLKGCLQRKPRKRTTAKAEPLEVEPTAFFVERSRCH